MNGKQMKRIRSRMSGFLLLCTLLWPAATGHSQGITTGSITGSVKDSQGALIPGTSITATHEPSGTAYETISREDGRFSLPGMRVGGPYRVTATLPGFGTEAKENVTVALGAATDLEFILKVAGREETVTVLEQNTSVLTAEKTGAGTAMTRDDLATLPTISGRLESITRLTPQYGGTMSFAGQDSRLNNITVDGSYFNNSFGLGNTPGDRTGVAPISLAAIEAIQVNVAPYDVRQGNFVGAGINTVTRSGTNEFRGSVYRTFRNESMVGTKAKGQTFNPGTFNFANTGFWVGGPVQRNKSFFFANFENEALTQPGTTFRANTGGQPVAGNTTRVLASDLDALRSYLLNNFKYETGPYQDYDFKTPAKRFLAKGDYNISSRNKVVFRWTQLQSRTDVLVSNSSSLGFGNRRTSTLGLNFSNSNYKILENIKSGVGEWNAFMGTRMSNNLIVGYTHQDESRDAVGKFFPFVDILQGGSVYTSFGFEPFTPNNELRYNTLQVQDNFTRFGNRHSLTFGYTFEKYRSENVFFPGSQSVYTYNSLADFYADANNFLANPNRTTSPVSLAIFQVRWNNIPNQVKPIQPLAVKYTGGYVQDQWRPTENFALTAGIRLDVPYFASTGYANADADKLTFRDEKNSSVQYSTAKLPGANVLWSPRVGFNWNAIGDRRLQVRGGSGIFTGPPAYVWISNQIGNTGVLTGFEDLRNTTARPFSSDTNRYKPTSVTGAPASSYELALTDPNFKFPQIWRTDIGVDHRLPLGFIATGDFIYNRDINGIYYTNANQTQPNSAFVGPDNRPRWFPTSANRIYSNVQNAIVMKNQNVGRSWNIAASATRTYGKGFFVKGAYSYGKSKNTVDPGSIAFGSWNNNPHNANPNLPGVGISANAPGHRVFLAGTFRQEYFKFGATTVSSFFEGFQSNTSYLFTGDLNGDGGTGNDLIYIPKDVSEMNFQPFTVGTGSSAVTFSASDQSNAWNTYIENDNYLRRHRGEYARRGAIFLPMVWRMDLGLAQEFLFNAGGKRHGFQLRLDILNFTNLLNSNWGVGQRLQSNQPLTNPGADAQGRALYRLRAINNQLLTVPLQTSAGTADVWKILIGFRFAFNNVGFIQ
jgi:hypothetical protein